MRLNRFYNNAKVMYMASYRKDYAFGKQKESTLLKHLAKTFKEDILPLKNRYALFDGESATTLYEIKSRRCLKNTYDTTILPVSKINCKTNKRKCFVFYFTDGIYYIHYDAKVFADFEQKEIIYYRSGICNNPVLHVCIPVVLLIKLK